MITENRVKQIIRESIYSVIAEADNSAQDDDFLGKLRATWGSHNYKQPEGKNASPDAAARRAGMSGSGKKPAEEKPDNQGNAAGNNQNPNQTGVQQQGANQQYGQNGLRPRPQGKGYFNGPFKQLTSNDYDRIMRDLVNNANLDKTIAMSIAGKLGLDPSRVVEPMDDQKPQGGQEKGQPQNNQDQTQNNNQQQQTGKFDNMNYGGPNDAQPEDRNGNAKNIIFDQPNNNGGQNESRYRYRQNELMYEGKFKDRMKSIGKEFGKAWNAFMDDRETIAYIKEIRYFWIDVKDILADDKEAQSALETAIKTRIKDLKSQYKHSYTPKQYERTRGKVTASRLQSTRAEGKKVEDALVKAKQWNSVGYETRRTVKDMQEIYNPNEYWQLNDDWLKYVYYKLKRMGIYYT